MNSVSTHLIPETFCAVSCYRQDNRMKPPRCRTLIHPGTLSDLKGATFLIRSRKLSNKKLSVITALGGSNFNHNLGHGSTPWDRAQFRHGFSTTQNSDVNQTKSEAKGVFSYIIYAATAYNLQHYRTQVIPDDLVKQPWIVNKSKSKFPKLKNY